MSAVSGADQAANNPTVSTEVCEAAVVSHTPRQRGRPRKRSRTTAVAVDYSEDSVCSAAITTPEEDMPKLSRQISPKKQQIKGKRLSKTSKDQQRMAKPARGKHQIIDFINRGSLAILLKIDTYEGRSTSS